MGWTVEKVNKLKELWGKNTASEIASILGEVSRNAVIGKAYRLNLAAKSIPKNNSYKQTPDRIKNSEEPDGKKQRRSKFKSLLLDKNFEPENPKSLEELTDEICRWPLGHPDEPNFYFCGRKSMKDFSYCKLHVLYAFQPKNKKEELITKEDGVPRFIEKKIKSA